MSVAYDTDLPQADVQGGGSPEPRSNRYGEAYGERVNIDAFAEEGSLFAIHSATLGTGIAQTANTTEDTTKPFIVGYNGAAGTSMATRKSIRLLRLTMRPTAVSSGQVIQNISVVTCAGNAYTSAGTDYNLLVSGLNATVGYTAIGRADKNPSSILGAMRVGVPVATLGTTPKLAARWSPRTTTIPVIGDEYVTYFGGRGPTGGEVIGQIPATIGRIVKYADPVIIPPLYSFMIIPWAAGIGGAMSWEFELVWAER